MRCVAKPAATRTALVVLAITTAVILSACSESEPSESSLVTAPSTSSAETTSAPTSATSATTTSSTTEATPQTTTGTSMPQEPAIELSVPPGPPPVVDGFIGEAEWLDAAAETMSDGAMVRWMHDDETLYVAVEGTDIGAVNVLIATDGEVLILHSSAALGSARYTLAAETWNLEHGFSWCCRNATDESGPAQLFADEGWRANIGFAGTAGVVEYAIALPWQGAAVAVSSIRDDDNKGFWPADISAEGREQLLGVPPPERSFKIGEWARLVPAE